VTPSSHARYDIKQLKEDTLWLSKQTNIDEVSALRIAVLEWQTRSAAQLLRGQPGDQSTSVNGARGVNQLRSSSFDPGSSLRARSSLLAGEGPFVEDNSSRRQRLLETYLSERRYILKSGEYITFAALCHRDEGPGKAADEGRDRLSWMEEVGRVVLSAWSLEDSPKGNRKSLVVDAVEALRARFEAMGKGCGWLHGEGIEEEIEFAWVRNQLVEAIHIMRIVLNNLEASTNLMKAPTILTWFRLMNECVFLESVDLVSLKIHRKQQLLIARTAISNASGPIRYTASIASSADFTCYTPASEGSRIACAILNRRCLDNESYRA
jgi:nuclear pore complex protein Nup188